MKFTTFMSLVLRDRIRSWLRFLRLVCRACVTGKP